MTEKHITEEQAEKFLKENTPPEDIKPKGAPFIFEIQVDNPVKQELRKLKGYTTMARSIPPLLPDEARLVLHLLFECFEKAGFVAEGLIGDILWGFEQVYPPTPRALTYAGLKYLETYGYIKCQAKDGAYVSLDSDASSGAFIRYQPKLLELVYENPAPI
jgi:hypothetical protein